MYHFSNAIHGLAIFLIVAVAVIAPAHPVNAKATEVAHIWRFTYERIDNKGILDVMVVEHDVITHEILNIFAEFTYTAPCQPVGGNVTCDLDIKSAIIDAYYQMNYKELAARVNSAESYRWMIVESTGRWSNNLPKSQTGLASHPSLQVGVETLADNRVRYSSTWNSHSITSQPYVAQAGVVYTMTNKFSCNQNGGCVSEMYVLAGQRPIALGSRALPATTTVGFRLAPSQLQIIVPPGFQLDTFVIDPPKAGYG